MRLLASKAAVAVGFAASLLVIGAGSAEAATLPSGFEERTIASGLSLPTAIAWAPDGRMFVAEKSGGRASRHTRTARPAPARSTSRATSTASATRGCWGWRPTATSPTTTTSTCSTCTSRRPSRAAASPRTSRLTRVTVNANNTASAETVILGSVGTPPCPAPVEHGRLHPLRQATRTRSGRFAPHPTARSGSATATRRIGRRSTRWRSASTTSRAWPGRSCTSTATAWGCPATRSAPPTTTSRTSARSSTPRACATRSASRCARAPGRSSATSAGRTHEEIDLMTAPGRNYGWPCYEGPFHTSGYQDLSGCPPEYANEGTAQADTLPDYDYAHPTSPTTTRPRSSAGPLYPGGAYPSDFNGDIFFGDYVPRSSSGSSSTRRATSRACEPFATDWPGGRPRARPRQRPLLRRLRRRQPGHRHR